MKKPRTRKLSAPAAAGRARRAVAVARLAANDSAGPVAPIARVGTVVSPYPAVPLAEWDGWARHSAAHPIYSAVGITDVWLMVATVGKERFTLERQRGGAREFASVEAIVDFIARRWPHIEKRLTVEFFRRTKIDKEGS